jgi:hypothetical protein
MSAFWDKVDKSGECWVWTAANNGSGYGRFWLDGKMQYPHRVAYEMCVGPIPDGLVIDHLCRNRSCVRPDHLEPVTNAENQARGAHAMKTHCPQGHPYDEVNTYRTKTGRRMCRACNRDAQRRYVARMRESI